GGGVSGDRQNQGRGELDRRRRKIASMENIDVTPPGCLEVERGISGARRCYELQVRQPLDESRRHWRSLPHEAKDLERKKPLRQLLKIGDMIREDLDFGVSRNG